MVASAMSCAFDADAENIRARALFLHFILTVTQRRRHYLGTLVPARCPQGTSEAHPGGLGPRCPPGVGLPPP